VVMDYRGIACAVLTQALRGATRNPPAPDARMCFLTDGPLFRLWAAWADVDPTAVREALVRRMADRPVRPRDRRSLV
jgi:hypothetical protein